MPPVLYHLKVLIVHATDGHGIASELEDELAVSVYADDVTLVAGERIGEDAELYVILDNLLEGIVKKGTSSGCALTTFMKGCMIESLIEAGLSWQQSLTKWYCGK